jgi:hypothetical protein
MSPESILKGTYPPDLVDTLIESYREIEHNYALGKWKASELDAGHFVEASRRMLEHALLGASTPIGKELPKFNEAALKTYEQSSGDESLRILIPRILWSVFGIRNKRGVGHVGPISPNEMDSALILGNVKWVLAEFVRLASGLSPKETQSLIDEIVQRKLGLLWKHGDITRILNPKIPAREQVLLLLYDKSPQKAIDLQSAVEYANPTNFKAIVKNLHSKRFIEFTADTTCIITTAGVVEGERLVKKLNLIT